jgi:hypothetical protein
MSDNQIGVMPPLIPSNNTQLPSNSNNFFVYLGVFILALSTGYFIGHAIEAKTTSKVSASLVAASKESENLRAQLAKTQDENQHLMIENKRLATLQKIANQEADERQSRIADLDTMVDDYNHLLRQGDDDRAKMTGDDEYYHTHGGDEYAEIAEVHLQSTKTLVNHALTLTEQAKALYRKIKAHPDFNRLYRETTLSTLLLNIETQENLRYIEKRQY